VKVAICAALRFGIAIALGVLTAVLTSRLRSSGERTGVDIALLGGLAASLMLQISALAQWISA
jgi:hypothetical protein